MFSFDLESINYFVLSIDKSQSNSNLFSDKRMGRAIKE